MFLSFRGKRCTLHLLLLLTYCLISISIGFVIPECSHIGRDQLINQQQQSSPCRLVATHLEAQHGFDVKDWLPKLGIPKRIRSFFRLLTTKNSPGHNASKVQIDGNFSAVLAKEIVTLEEDDEPAATSRSTETLQPLPQGPRWAIAAPTTDLSGSWKPVVTSSFKQQYDTYLECCGEGLVFRKALVSTIGLAKEIYEQRDQGRELIITGSTPIGSWQRILVSSGADADTVDFEPLYSTFKDPDGETVQVEAWWENDGTVHKSWLRNKPRVLGGAFESTRYFLPDDEDVLVCESVFHPPPNNTKFQKGSVEWRFRREE